MPDNENLDPRNLTFSQAQGYEALPGPLALEELSRDARRELWDLLYKYVIQFSGLDLSRVRRLTGDWRSIARTLHSEILKSPLDQFDSRTQSFSDNYRALILRTLPFNRVFDLLQIIMRHDHCPPEFVMEVKVVFERCRLAYLVDTNGPPTILPMSTRQEGEAVSEAIRTFRTIGLTGAETHLRKAADLINQGDWSGSVRESIHCVESIARRLAPDASKSLAPALKSLEKNHPLHPALREAFSKLYGYTSDEEGIRHPLINSSSSHSGRDEAVFMLGACASFASYLWRVNQGHQK